MKLLKNLTLIAGLVLLSLPATAQLTTVARPDCKCPVSHQVGDTITVDGVVEYVTSVSIEEHCPEGDKCDESKCKFKFRSKPRGGGLSTLHKRTADCESLTTIGALEINFAPVHEHPKQRSDYPIIDQH